MNLETCPCGEPEVYSACCEPLHRGEARATTARQLMRSRYAAYFMGELDYLLETLHPSRHRAGERDRLGESLSRTRWVGLRILDTKDGGPADTTGEVEFEASFQNERTGTLRERSRFVKENDRWYYVDGDHLEPLAAGKPGRNDPCPCGSGKKHKKCCGQ
jgi:SEC-C motif domain protein